MNPLLTALYLRFRYLIACEEGQDLVEYSLVIAMIAFGAITGMGVLATGINTEFSIVATTLTTSTT